MSEMLDKYYTIRDYKPEDKNFILATFLRGLYYGDSWFSIIPKDIFMNNYKHVAVAMLGKNFIQVACLKDDPDVILGYAWMSKDLTTLHWVYVKEDFRKMGIAKSLIPGKFEYVSHLSALGKQLLTKFEKVYFNPFKLT